MNEFQNPVTEQESVETAYAVPTEEVAQPEAAAPLAAGNPVVDFINKNRKQLLLGVAALAAVLVVVLLCIALFGGNGGNGDVIYDGSYALWGNKVVMDGKVVAEFEEDEVSLQGAPNDLSALFVAAYDEGDEDAKTLYVVNKKGATKVADNVDDVEIAGAAAAAVYTDVDGVFYWYNGKKTETLTDAQDVALSPDGKTVAYEVESDDGEKVQVFVKNFGKKATEIDVKNADVRAVSNKGDYLYLTKYDDEAGSRALYRVVKKGEPEKLCNNVDEYEFNADVNEVMFSDTDGKYYVAQKKAEKIKLFSSNGYVYPVNVPYTTAMGSYLERVYKNGSTLLYIDKDGESHKIASDVSDYQLCEDGKLYFTKTSVITGESTLYYVKDATKGGEYKTEKLANDVEYITVSPDGKYVYSTDGDDTLYAYKGEKKTKIADDVYSIYGVSEKGYCYFVDNDGIVYASKNAGEKKKIVELEEDDEWGGFDGGVSVMPGNTYYKAGDDLYVGKGDTKFEKLATR